MTEQTAKLVRAVGFWGLVAMCINAVVGSGVFLQEGLRGPGYKK